MRIEIPNLPQHVSDMLDIMWQCETQQELLEFRGCLSAEEYQLSETCELLMVQAIMDSLVEDEKDFSTYEVAEVLVRYRTNN